MSSRPAWAIQQECISKSKKKKREEGQEKAVEEGRKEEGARPKNPGALSVCIGLCPAQRYTEDTYLPVLMAAHTAAAFRNQTL